MEIWMEEGEYLDKKEAIAREIFDYPYEDENRPTELECHTLAEKILELVYGSPIVTFTQE